MESGTFVWFNVVLFDYRTVSLDSLKLQECVYLILRYSIAHLQKNRSKYDVKVSHANNQAEVRMKIIVSERLFSE